MKALREHISPDTWRSFHVRRHVLRKFDCPYHYHDEIELTLILKGYGQRLVGDHLDRFGPGDLLLMGPRLPHTYFHPPRFNQGLHGAESIVVQFLPEVFGDVLGSPECRSLKELLRQSALGLEVPSGRLRDDVAALMERLVEAKDWRSWCLLLEALGLLAEATTLKPMASAIFVPEWNLRRSERIGRVCSWITTHFREPVTLKAAARQAHMSPPAFSRFFHRATSRTFTHFVNELRIGHACRLLIETDKTVAEIAYDSGFENLSNFNRRFLEMRHSTPRLYRAKAVLPGTPG